MSDADVLYKLNDHITQTLHELYGWTSDTEDQESLLNDAVHDIAKILEDLTRK